MVNIEQFLKSLKLTWLRRTIKENISKQFAYHQIILKKSLFYGLLIVITYKLILSI